MVTAVVINRCFGGFGFSAEAIRWLRAHGYEPANSVPVGFETHSDGTPASSFGDQYYIYLDDDSDEKKLRTDPLVVECVRTLGAKASGGLAHLTVVEVPDDVNWHIHDYDGVETVAEDHRTWS